MPPSSSMTRSSDPPIGMSSSLQPPPPPLQPDVGDVGPGGPPPAAGPALSSRDRVWSARPWLAVLILIVVLGVGVAVGWGLRGAAVAGSNTAQPAPSPTVAEGERPAPSASQSQEPSAPPPPAAPEDLIEQLEALPSPSGNVPGYDRALFGQTWFDSDRNGCDTRNDILRRDLTDVVIGDNSNGCKVLRGTLIDPYSGDAMTFVSGVDTSVLVQIDHVVPLAWAWDNGASAWTLEQRQDFANDPRNLLAVSGELNQQKLASGPASWLPPNRAAHCAYAGQFAEVLVQYRLSMPDDDEAVLIQILEDC